MEENNALLADYQAIVSHFCVLLARLAAANKRIKNGESVELAYLDALTDQVLSYQKALLVVKDRLEYSDGLSFLEDCKFRGFTLQDGQIEGETENLIRFVTPWVMEFPSESTNNYKFEVGSLLIALAHEQVQVNECT